MKRSLLKNEKFFLDSIHPETDVLSLMVATGMSTNVRHDILDKPGLPRKMRLFEHLLLIIESEDCWNNVIEDLKSSKKDTLVNRLLDDYKANQEMDHEDFIKGFSLAVAEYYQLHFAKVHTFWDSERELEDIKIVLQSSSNPKEDKFDHEQLLERLYNYHSGNSAWIQGDVSMGKTTLMKKISYNWANRYTNGYISPFRLILFLESSRSPGTNLLQLAIDYYFDQLNLSMNKEKLMDSLAHLGPKLLVCLDDPDDLRNLSIKGVSYKLIVTSRYSQFPNGLVSPILCKIQPFNPRNFEKFCQLHSRGTGLREAMRFLSSCYADVLIKIPLFVIFICYLSDTTQAIPNSLTALFELFVSHSISKYEKQGEAKDKDAWMTMPIVRNLAELAYRGCCEFNTYTFTEEQYEGKANKNIFFRVNFDATGNCMRATFLHPSLQDFFAALHCYESLMNNDNKIERNSVVKKMYQTDGNNFSRFFFGICSKFNQFDKMLKWLQPTFKDHQYIENGSHNHNNMFHLSSEFLIDCSDEENFQFGHWLTGSVSLIEEEITTEREKMWTGTSKFIFDPFLNPNFQKGLRIQLKNHRTDNSIMPTDILSIESDKEAKLICVTDCNGPIKLEDNYEEVAVLIQVVCPSFLSKQTISYICLSATPVKTLVITIAAFGLCDVEVNFCVKHDLPMIKLRNFCFQFHRNQLNRLRQMFPANKADLSGMTIESINRLSETTWISVKIDCDISETCLVEQMIQYAIDMIEE